MYLFCWMTIVIAAYTGGSLMASAALLNERVDWPMACLGAFLVVGATALEMMIIPS